MKSILDKRFKYVPSHETDVRKTFARIRKAAAKPAPANVRPLRKEAKK